MNKTLAKNFSNMQLAQFSPLNFLKTHSYVNIITDDTEQLEVHDELSRLFETAIFSLTHSSALTYWQGNVVAQFEQYSAEVMEDCIMVSSPTQIILHPSYQKLIGLGRQIMPLLLAKLDESPAIWFKALEAISGFSPIQKSNRGVVPLMVQDWKKWARENGYV